MYVMRLLVSTTIDGCFIYIMVPKGVLLRLLSYLEVS